jgi:predicted lipase
MCREPFDVPTYRCRLIIERVASDPPDRRVTNFETQNVMSIVEGFGLDFRSLVPGGSTSRFYTDIHFDIEPSETLEDVLRELGLPIPN